MNIHKNARWTSRGREEAVRAVTQFGEPARQVARTVHVTEKTIRNWVGRAAEAARLGLDLLVDRHVEVAGRTVCRCQPSRTRRLEPGSCISRCVDRPTSFITRTTAASKRPSASAIGVGTPATVPRWGVSAMRTTTRCARASWRPSSASCLIGTASDARRRSPCRLRLHRGLLPPTPPPFRPRAPVPHDLRADPRGRGSPRALRSYDRAGGRSLPMPLRVVQ